MQKVNVPTVIVMVEKKILLMKAVASALTTRENVNHVNKKIIEIMENAVTLEVPNKVDYEFGSNWGDIYD